MVAWFFYFYRDKSLTMETRLKRARGFLQVLVALATSVILSIVTFAQDKQVDINVNTNKGNGWGNPWMWVVGAAVFILLLVALLRNRGSREA